MVMITKRLSAQGRAILQADGWKVLLLNELPNPFIDEQKASVTIWTTFTKLLIWNLTEYVASYKLLVYLTTISVMIAWYFWMPTS